MSKYFQVMRILLDSQQHLSRVRRPRLWRAAPTASGMPIVASTTTGTTNGARRDERRGHRLTRQFEGLEDRLLLIQAPETQKAGAGDAINSIPDANIGCMRFPPKRGGTVDRSVFPVRHAGLWSGGMDTVSDSQFCQFRHEHSLRSVRVVMQLPLPLPRRRVLASFGNPPQSESEGQPQPLRIVLMAT